MNDWYIDRSKNFINNTLDRVIDFLATYSGQRDSSSLITQLEQAAIFDKDAGNSYAALTRFRDHGLIDNNNELGDSAMDYYKGFLSRDELILDLFIKRSACKKDSPNLKPLVLLCRAFDLMLDLVADMGDVYLTYEECFKYLYCCNDLTDLSVDLIDAIIDGRSTGKNHVTMKQNEITNLSIWFNALKNTPLFVSEEEKTMIRPNLFAKDLIKFISINGSKLTVTPTASNTTLYKYYCNRSFGFNEIIPYVFNQNIILKNRRDAVIVFNYMFGIKKEPEYDYGFYFSRPCFGVYSAFLYVPGLVIRKIYLKNMIVGDDLYRIINNMPTRCIYDVE